MFIVLHVVGRSGTIHRTLFFTLRPLSLEEYSKIKGGITVLVSLYQIIEPFGGGNGTTTP